MNLHFHSDQREKTNKWAGNMFHVDVNMKRLGISFKNDSVQWFRVDSFFYTWCTFRFNTFQDVFIHVELCYTRHESSFSKIHNRGTLIHIKMWTQESLSRIEMHSFYWILGSLKRRTGSRYPTLPRSHESEQNAHWCGRRDTPTAEQEWSHTDQMQNSSKSLPAAARC